MHATKASSTEKSSPDIAARNNKPVSVESEQHLQANPVWHGLVTNVGSRAAAASSDGPPPIQTKLTIGEPDDEYEQEADQVAEQVMRMPLAAGGQDDDDSIIQPKIKTSPMIQRLCQECEEELQGQNTPSIQTKLHTTGSMPSSSSTIQRAISSSAGTPMHDSVRSRIEPVLNTDLSHVRVHSSSTAQSAAQSINARAFTHQNNIYLGSGQSAADTKLMAHESTHVVQQGAGRSVPGLQRRIVMRNLTPETRNVPLLGNVQVGTTENLRPVTADEVESYINDIGTVHHDYDDIINGTGEEFDFVADATYRRNLIISIIRNMHRVDTDLYFDNYQEAVREVRKRALISLFMRASQGRSRGNRPTGYPRSCGANPGPRVSQAASNYWIVHPDVGNESYWFELSSDGRSNAHDALRTLIFNHQTDVCLRTLMHCDYMISAQQFYVMADAMGATDFNTAVLNGNINLEIRWNSFENIVADTPTSPGQYQSLQSVNVSSEREFIIGDHVIFFNHDAFDDMNEVHYNVHGNYSNWRLENAIISDIDPGSGEFRFQGHGYFSPKRRTAFVNAMVGKMNDLVVAANRAISAGNTNHLGFPYADGSRYEVVRSAGQSWNIHYHEGLGTESGQSIHSMPLRRFTPADFPNPFVQPGETQIQVRRPIESRRESLTTTGGTSAQPGGGTSATPSTPLPMPTPTSPTPIPTSPPTSPTPPPAPATGPIGTPRPTTGSQSRRQQRRQQPQDQQGPEVIEMPEEVITAETMDCDNPTKATSMTQYSFLVRCLEILLSATHGPVDILRTLRELYYGGSRFDSAACGERESGTVSRLRSSSPALHTALKDSKTSTGVDVGHIFTGLEGMLCPRTRTSLAWYAPSVNMANEDVLTWGGDIGSAAAGRLRGYNDSGWIFRTEPSWKKYFLSPGTLASREDLLGDIDAFSLRANVKGFACSATKGTRMPAPTTPMSRLLLEFYGAPPSMATGLTSADRFRCFAEAVGATIVGRSIINKATLVSRFTPQVFSFANLFYLGMRWHHLGTMSLGDLARLLNYSRQITGLFFDWIEKNLP